MKPTTSDFSRPFARRHDGAIPEHRSIQRIDYGFQSTVDLRGSPRSWFKKYPLELRSFRSMSREFLDGETSRNYLIEFALFVLITALSTWSMVPMIAALARMMR